MLSVAIAASVALLLRPGEFVLGCRLVGEQPFDGQEHLFGDALLPLAPSALTWTWFLGLDFGSENGAYKRTFKRTYSRTYCDLKLLQVNGKYSIYINIG